MEDTVDYLEIDDLWVIQNEAHLAVVAEWRKAGLSGDEACDYWTREMSDWYEELILSAKEAYYNTGKAIMSDMAYDKLEELLRYIKPKSKVLKQVGSQILENDKV